MFGMYIYEYCPFLSKWVREKKVKCISALRTACANERLKTIVKRKKTVSFLIHLLLKKAFCNIARVCIFYNVLRSLITYCYTALNKYTLLHNSLLTNMVSNHSQKDIKSLPNWLSHFSLMNKLLSLKT